MSERGLKAAGIKLLGTGETQELFLPSFTDDVIGTVTSFHYTETNTNPENIALKNAARRRCSATRRRRTSRRSPPGTAPI